MKNALDSQLQREKTWKRKRSSVVQSENALNEEQPNLPTEVNENEVKKIKKSVSKNLNEEMKDHWLNHMKSLVVQGDFISAVDTMDSDFNYKSILYELPRNSCIDTLPTNANLNR